MRNMNLIPEDVLARRRRARLLRRSIAALGAWGALLGVGVLGLARQLQDERATAARIQEQVQACRADASRLESLRRQRELLADRWRVVQQLEARRPVTGLVTLVAARLPPRLRLEQLYIVPAAPLASQGQPGQTGYFAMPSATAAGMQVELRGTALGPDDVAELLRALETCGRFRSVRLARVDRAPEGEDPGLRFEMRCEM